jgi:hypothetical protein
MPENLHFVNELNLDLGHDCQDAENGVALKPEPSPSREKSFSD